MDGGSAKGRGALLMAACAVLWSTGGLLIKLIPWNPLVIAGFRSMAAAAVVAAYMAANRMRFRLSRASALAGVMLTLTLLSFVTANKLTTAANAIVLQFTAPIFIVIVSAVFLGQRFRREDYAVVAVTLFGVALCFSGQMEAGNLAGNCVGVLSGLFFGLMYVTMGNAGRESRMSGILFGQLLTALAGMPLALVFPTPAGAREVALIAVLGLLQVGLPYILYAAALESCTPLTCSLIGVLEPLLSPVWVFLFSGEAPGLLSLAGGAVVLATITVWTVRGARRSGRQPQTANTSGSAVK